MVKLPIDTYEHEILNAVSENDITIISAETGTGKSSRIPMMLMRQGYKVVVTQPRRVAAIFLATRVAEENGIKLGETVGYATGFDKLYTPETDVLFCTDGLQLVRELTGLKSKKEVLIIDEVHEMNLNIETLLAWIKHNKERKYKVVIMSATLNSNELEEFFKDENSVTVIKCRGEQYDVTEEFKGYGELYEEIKKSIFAGKNTLVFCAGKPEIEEILGKTSLYSCVRLPLHGELPYAEQKKCFDSYNMPKLIVSTNVAQTSITIPDIDTVIDTGMTKMMQVDEGVESLVLANCSKADIIQRKGRAGRTKPGKYVLCADYPYEYRKDTMEPEIERLNLDQIVLRLASIGLDATELQFLHQPSAEALESAKKLLVMLGALNEFGKITELGKEMAKMPVSARPARMLLAAKKYGCLKTTCIMAAVLENGSLLSKDGSYFRFKMYGNPYRSDLILEAIVYEYIKAHVPIDFNKENLNGKTYFRVKEYVNKLYEIFASDIASESDEDNLNESNLIKVVFTGMPEVYTANFDICVDSEGRTYNQDKKSGQHFSGNLMLGKPITISYKDKYNCRRAMNLLTCLTLIDVEFLRKMAKEDLKEELGEIEYVCYNDTIRQEKKVYYKGSMICVEYNVIEDNPELLKQKREEYEAERRRYYGYIEPKVSTRQTSITIPSGIVLDVRYDWKDSPYIIISKEQLEDTAFPERLTLENGKMVKLICGFIERYDISSLKNALLQEEMTKKLKGKTSNQELVKISTYNDFKDISSKIGEENVSVELFGKKLEKIIYTYIVKDKKGDYILKISESKEGSIEPSELIQYFFEKEIDKKFSENVFFFTIKGKRTLTNKGSKALGHFHDEKKMILSQVNTENFEECIEYLELAYEEAKEMLEA